MTDSQKVIGKYILENYPLAAFLSAAEFAREAGVSGATIVRFAQELGFSGFTEMKNSIKSQLRGSAPEEKREQIHAMGLSESKGLDELFQSYDEALLESGAQAIFKARDIYFAALGSAVALQNFPPERFPKTMR